MPPTSSKLAPAAPATWREWLLVLGAACAVVAVLTAPTLPQLGSAGRFDSGDGRFSIWNIGWIDHAVLTDPRHLFDANIFWPHTGTLAYSELNLVAGALGLPAFLVTHNAVAALNGSVLIAMVLAIVCLWALVRRLTGSSGAGVVAGVLFAFCPYVQGHTAHIQLLMVFVFPLVFLSFDRLRVDPSPMRGVELGGSLAVAALASGYYGIYGGLLLGVAVLVFARRTARYWVALVVAAGTAALFTAPALVPFERIRSAIGTAPVRGAGEAQVLSATIRDFASSSSPLEQWVWHLHWTAGGDELLFPGLVLSALAAVGFWMWCRSSDRAERRVAWGFAAVGAFACWASFGPTLGLYALLMKAVPFMDLLRAPSRMGAGVMFVMAVAAGLGVARIARGRAWVVGVLILAAVIDLRSPWPLRPEAPVPAAYLQLARLPAGAAIDFPFPYSYFPDHTKAMFWSTYHWHPLVNGYSDVTPPDFEPMALPVNGFPDPASFEILHTRDVRYVIWHLDEYGAYRQALLKRLPPYASYLRPLVTEGDVWLYEIVGWPPPGAGK